MQMYDNAQHWAAATDLQLQVVRTVSYPDTPSLFRVSPFRVLHGVTQADWMASTIYDSWLHARSIRSIPFKFLGKKNLAQRSDYRNLHPYAMQQCITVQGFMFVTRFRIKYGFGKLGTT